MINKPSTRKGSSVLGALVILCAVVGYGLAVWWPELIAPETGAFSGVTEAKSGREQIAIPSDGPAVRVLTMNAGNYFVPEDPRRSQFPAQNKKIEAREALAELISQFGAAVVGLCEMGGEAAVSDLQMRLKRRAVHLPYRVLVMRKGEDRGLALLSKYPVEANRSVQNMPIPGEEQGKRMMLRGILDATVKVPDGRLFRLIGVHLKSRVGGEGLAEEFRRKEAYALRSYLNDAQAVQEGMPLLLYGDFNDGPANHSVGVIQGAVKTDFRLNRLKPKDSRGETWTIYYNEGDSYHSFDHLFVNDVLGKRLGRKPRQGVLDGAISRQASDHRGVWVELR